MTTAQVKANEVENDLAVHAGQYMTFKLGEENFGIEILKVQEIIGMQTVTAVPKTPHYVRGVINLRGKVIPVIDLRTKFKMERVEDTEKTVNIVVQVSSASDTVTIGFVVDEVSEVVDVAENTLEEVPQFDTNVETDFLSAMAKVDDAVVMLLDVDKVLEGSDLSGSFTAE